MSLRIALIDETGECEIGGQRCKVVPVEPTEAMIDSPRSMFSALEFGNKECSTAREHMRRYDGHSDNLPEWFNGPAHLTKAGRALVVYQRMLSAAALDLSGLPVVPERVLLDSDPFCPKCGHNRDISSVSSVGVKGGEHECQLCAATWTEAALDAILQGAK